MKASGPGVNVQHVTLVCFFLICLTAFVIAVQAGWAYFPAVVLLVLSSGAYGHVSAIRSMATRGGLVVVKCPHCEIDGPNQADP